MLEESKVRAALKEMRPYDIPDDMEPVLKAARIAYDKGLVTSEHEGAYQAALAAKTARALMMGRYEPAPYCSAPLKTVDDYIEHLTKQ